MFTTALTNLKGIPAQASWATHFQDALAALQAFTPATVEQAIDACLDAWARGSAGLAADPSYQASERYCIRQSYLWRIYAALEAKGQGGEAARKVYNRARDVMDETPASARPSDLRFTQGDELIKNTIQHLREVDQFYRRALGVDSGATGSARSDLPDLPPTTDGFFCTVKLTDGMNQDLARHFWQQFKADNSRVRIVTLGNDAQASETVDMADPIFFAPGGAQKPGRCLWVALPALQTDVKQWLQQQGFGQPEAARCIFLKAAGTLSSVLKKSDMIDETAILDEFLKASS